MRYNHYKYQQNLAKHVELRLLEPEWPPHTLMLYNSANAAWDTAPCVFGDAVSAIALQFSCCGRALLRLLWDVLTTFEWNEGDSQQNQWPGGNAARTQKPIGKGN